MSAELLLTERREVLAAGIFELRKVLVRYLNATGDKEPYFKAMWEAEIAKVDRVSEWLESTVNA